MTSTRSTVLLGMLMACPLLACPAVEALAQSARDVPIQQDLRREERIERRLDRNRPPPVDPNVTPDNPDGVVGFDGPPGMFENGVENGGPIPPGSPVDDDDD